MTTSFKSILFLLTFAAFGLTTLSPCGAQQNNLPTDLIPAEIVDSEIVILNLNDSQPVETQSNNATNFLTVNPAAFSPQAETTDCDICQSNEANVVTDEQLFPEVKNVNFFGVDRESCCDEWSGLCKMKSLKYGCNCGGLKANKGHLGFSWLRTRRGGEGCDYCNGGCCEKGTCGQQCRDKSCLGKCLGKCFGKGSRDKSCGCQDKPTQRFVFGRPVESSCQECGCCDKTCPPEEGCESCK